MGNPAEGKRSITRIKNPFTKLGRGSQHPKTLFLLFFKKCQWYRSQAQLNRKVTTGRNTGNAWSIDLGGQGGFTGGMRIGAAAILAGSLALTGCAGRKPGGAFSSIDGAPAPDRATPVAPAPVPAPAPQTSFMALVARVNVQGQYVILTFSGTQLPASGVPLNVYRQGLKVAELRVADNRMDANAVADIVSGEPRTGDQALDR
jgi:hypothetical protein